jgi:hypothetical protein
VRTRLAAQTSQRYYTGIGQALRRIVADEGARGLYRGLGPTLLQVLAGAQLYCSPGLSCTGFVFLCAACALASPCLLPRGVMHAPTAFA